MYITGRENLRACGWKCKGGVSSSVIHEMHMILSYKLLSVHNYHVVRGKLVDRRRRGETSLI